MVTFMCQLGYAVVPSYSIKQFWEKQKQDCIVLRDSFQSFIKKERRQDENQMCVSRTFDYIT